MPVHAPVHAPAERSHRPRADLDQQRLGGFAAVYLAVALLGAIPYFLAVVDYPGASTAAEKIDLILDHYPSLYVVELLTYVVFGLAVGVLALALWDRLRSDAPTFARLASAVGLLWAVALVASGMVVTYGMTTVHDLADSEPVHAVSTWRAVEPVALALGGAGGEVLGGLWVLLVSAVALRSELLPRLLGRLGLVVGTVGLVSVAPPLEDAAVVFGMLQIVWFAWLARILLTSPAHAPTPSTHTVTRDDAASM